MFPYGFKTNYGRTHKLLTMGYLQTEVNKAIKFMANIRVGFI